MLQCPFCYCNNDDSAVLCAHCASDLTGVTWLVATPQTRSTMLFPWLDEPHLEDDPNRPAQETAFLKSIIENPDDDTPRLVFADWLEENGQADKAAFVRLEIQFCQLPRSDDRLAAIRSELLRLDGVIGGRWTWALVRIGRLLNCGGAKSKDFAVRFTFECPNRWSNLTPTQDGARRFCNDCNQHVHFCQSKQEAEEHALDGHCIAIDSRLALKVRDEYAPKPRIEDTALPDLDLSEMTLGLATLPPSPYELWADDLRQRHRSRFKRWWQFWR